MASGNADPDLARVPDPDGLLTAKEAAALLGISEQTMTYHMRAGNLACRRLGREWVTTLAALRQFQRGRRRPGRPPKAPG